MKQKKLILSLISILIFFGCEKPYTPNRISQQTERSQDLSLPECSDWNQLDCRMTNACVESHIHLGDDVNSWTKAKFSGMPGQKFETVPLLSAALREDYAGVQRLLSVGANPNIVHSRMGFSILSLAAALGSVNSVQILLEAGTDLKQGGIPPIAAAAMNSKYGAEIIRLLASAGADPNAVCGMDVRGGEGLSAVDVASTNSNLTALLDVGAAPRFSNLLAIRQGISREPGLSVLVKRLIDAGLDVDVRNANDNSTFLMNIADSNDADAFKLLIDAGANVNAKDDNQKTVLHYVIQKLIWVSYEVKNETGKLLNREKLNIIKLLIDAGADVNAKDKNGITPLSLAMDRLDCQSFSMLIENGADLKSISSDNGDYDALMEFAVKCGGGTVKAVLASGADSNQIISSRFTIGENLPICIAIENNALSSLRALLEGGASAKDSPCGMPILFSVLKNEFFEEGLNKNDIQLLIYAGADVNAKSELSEKSPLMSAANLGKTEVFNALLDAGSRIEDVDIYGNSVLHYAVESNSLDIVEILLQKKVNIDAVNVHRETPLMKAKSPEMAEKLISAGANIHAADEMENNVLQRVLREENVEDTALFLIKSGADSKVSNKDGVSPLHSAVMNQYKRVYEKLIDIGADVNAKDNSGVTPLMIASYVMDKDAVRILLEHGADVHAKDKNDITALMRSFDNYDITNKSNINIIQTIADMLIDAGSDIHAVSKYGSVLSFAVRSGSADIVNKLLNSHVEITKDCDDCSKTELVTAIKLIVDLARKRSKLRSFIYEFSADESDLEAKKQYDAYNNQLETTDAALSELYKICDLLIHAGADITPAHRDEYWMESIVDTYLIRMFLKFGADPNSRFARDETPLMYALTFHNLESMQVLIDAGADLSQAIILGEYSLTYGSAAVMQKLIDNGLNLEQTSENSGNQVFSASYVPGVTLLMIAAKIQAPNENSRRGAESVRELSQLQVLIKAGAELNVQDSQGRTALHYAAEYSRHNNIKMLIDAGADADLKDKNGKTALDYLKDNDGSYISFDEYFKNFDDTEH